MANITVKNISEETYEMLKKTASLHHRSINGEIINLVEKAVRSQQINPELHLVRARKFREKTKKFLLTKEILHNARAEGRP